MAINSVSLLNTNSAVELVKANAVQFSNKNNNLNKVTTEKEANKNDEIKDSANISKEALEKFMAEKNTNKDKTNKESNTDKSTQEQEYKNQNIGKAGKDYGSDKSVQENEYKNINTMLSALKARKAYC